MTNSKASKVCFNMGKNEYIQEKLNVENAELREFLSDDKNQNWLDFYTNENRIFQNDARRYRRHNVS